MMINGGDASPSSIKIRYNEWETSRIQPAVKFTIVASDRGLLITIYVFM